MMRREMLLGALVCGLAIIATTAPAAVAEYQPDPRKVLRYAFEIAETTFDPHKVADVYSNIVNGGMFDAPLVYDHLATPAKLKLNTLAAMPEVSADFKTFTLRVKPGIYFADDLAFGGRPRELVAEDYVYSIKRLFDPKLTAPQLSEVEGFVLGSEDYIARARKANKLDYDAPFEGVKALDRYTFQVKLTHPKPVFIYNFADCRFSCAVAREVVEKYGAEFGAHPVGTGPFRLAEWRRSSKMVFEPNPNFREEYFDAEPNADDAEGQAILARLKGKRLPIIGRIEISIIEETQPRWISFLGRGQDLMWKMPEEFANTAVPDHKLAPNLKRLGLEFRQMPLLDITYTYFNMLDDTVGGYTPDKVALRRAITLAYKTQDEINVIRKGQAIPANTPYSPGVAGYDENFRTTANEYSPAKANALLDMYGYQRGDDGYRRMPDGRALVLKHNSTPTERDKQLDEMWKRSMEDIGVRFEVRKAKWPDLLKESYASKLMMWQLGQSASAPDADTWLNALYGPNVGQKGNQANFKLKAFDDAYEKASQLPDTPERNKLYQEMARLMVAYAPWRLGLHRIATDLWFPYVIGFRRPLVQTQNWWSRVDIDLALQQEYASK